MTAFSININDLLEKRKVESNRIEFKEGWNPDRIYRTICAFANDFDNLGGGYIVVGVEEKDGVALRPIKGIAPESIDGILKDMIGYNNKIEPYYMPRTMVEEVDGKTVLAIWVPSGAARPYSVSSDVTSKKNILHTYLRNGTATIEAKGEILDQMRDMANRTPFDERGNASISINDISVIKLYDYLQKIGSKLLDTFKAENLHPTLEALNLFEGAIENRRIKNIAAMMFCDNPQKFFPVSRVEIVTFPEGSINNPNNFIEAPIISGSVPEMIEKTMSYLKTNVIKEKVAKPKDDLRSNKYYNYPYQALEEAVANSLYHRDYQEREPVEITIEPDKISILSYSGPDRSISLETIAEGVRFPTRRYRNRRLGEFLKELNLTEGRSTGIPTIQKELKMNGSPKATFETDNERTFFLSIIPVHNGFINQDGGINGGINDDILSVLSNFEGLKSREIKTHFPNVSQRTIERAIKELKEIEMIEYKGSKKTGGYYIISNVEIKDRFK